MANIIKRVWNQNRMVQIEDLKGMTFQAEQAGHTFQISGIDDDGNTVALTGTPAGVLLRPDNTDVDLTCSVSGGVVSATLPANCYDVPGRFGLTIFITSGSSKTAIYAAVGTVTRTSSGTVAPGTSQSVVDLINAINAAVNSIPASYSALLADIAPTYSDSALYSVGQYAWYDGDLKRCIVPITTAESYTAAHWTSAVLGQDVSDLKSAFNDLDEQVNGDNESLTWTDGIFNAGGYTSSTKWVNTQVLSSGKYSVKVPSGYRYQIFYYVSDSSGTSVVTNKTADGKYTLSSSFIISAGRTDNGSLSASDKTAIQNGLIVKENSDSMVIAIDGIQGTLAMLPVMRGTLPNNTDLNSFFSPGWWYLDSNNTYVNLPANPITNVTALLIEQKGDIFFKQTLTSMSSGGGTTDADLSGYSRTVKNNTTSQPAWEYGYYFSESIYNSMLMPRGELPNNTDLNVFFTPGIWELNASYTYSNLPADEITAYSLLYVMQKYGVFECQILTNKTSGATTDARDIASYQRTVRTDRTSQPAWKYNYYTGDLKKEIDAIRSNTQKDTSHLVSSFTHSNYNSIAYNPQTAIRLKVGTINVGHYNYGAGDYYGLNDDIYNAKLHNWRKYFGANKVDILNVNEWVPYIDYLASGSYASGSKLASSYIYKPLYAYYDSDLDTAMIKAALLSKYSMTTPVHQTLTGLDGFGYASCSYSQISIDSTHTVGVYGVQLSWRKTIGADPTGEEAIANRLAEMGSLSSFIGTHSDTYVIVMGDFNTPTETDHTNLLSMCSSNNLIPCNGGWLDWERTHENGYCLDNILVSNNIIVEDFNSQSDWYDAISTDHFGINAELILT